MKTAQGQETTIEIIYFLLTHFFISLVAIFSSSCFSLFSFGLWFYFGTWNSNRRFRFFEYFIRCALEDISGKWSQIIIGKVTFPVKIIADLVIVHHGSKNSDYPLSPVYARLPQLCCCRVMYFLNL